MIKAQNYRSPDAYAHSPWCLVDAPESGGISEKKEEKRIITLVCCAFQKPRNSANAINFTKLIILDNKGEAKTDGIMRFHQKITKPNGYL